MKAEGTFIRKRMMDMELEAIAAVTNALARLTPAARTRVINYALRRLEDKEPTEAEKETAIRRNDDSLEIQGR